MPRFLPHDERKVWELRESKVKRVLGELKKYKFSWVDIAYHSDYSGTHVQQRLTNNSVVFIWFGYLTGLQTYNGHKFCGVNYETLPIHKNSRLHIPKEVERVFKKVIHNEDYEGSIHIITGFSTSGSYKHLTKYRYTYIENPIGCSKTILSEVNRLSKPLIETGFHSKSKREYEKFLELIKLR